LKDLAEVNDGEEKAKGKRRYYRKDDDAEACLLDWWELGRKTRIDI